ncbi:hypothetical protein SLS62_010404 [Diatrype stigma]|uniref:Cation/H+ exchanger transmembrane domain-containing protein n=1 Tax=Diatrype stigma TaxID=117547 RepID=A0AAN9YIB2_9PEZI
MDAPEPFEILILGMATSLPYQEPSITEILTLSSFLLALNVVNAVLDRTLYCGLVGQVLLGVAWGTPGGKWLSSSGSDPSPSSSGLDLERAVVQLGYLGLVLLVFEGGLSTSVRSMRANLLLSVCVALTGIAAPIALSFAALPPMLGGATSTSPAQSFAAGAALCSTSLGTTFAVLGASGLVPTRLGCVLTTAAMMDDVVGLVMVQVVASLGSSSAAFSAADTVLRPVLVSATFAVVPFLACRYVVRPSVAWLARLRVENETVATMLSSLRQGSSSMNGTRRIQGAFVVHTGLLLALVAGASFAGASVLLAAYVAGVVIAWWDAEEESAVVQRIPANDPAVSDSRHAGNVPAVGEVVEPGADGEATATTSTAETHIATTTNTTNNSTTHRDRDRQQELRAGSHCALEPASTVAPRQARGDEEARTTGLVVYEHYYSQAVKHILKPFFFASIGFSIPVSQMFERSILWRGIVYAVLMMIGKLFCGIWLVRFPLSPLVGAAAGKKGVVSSFISSQYHALLSVVRRGGGAAGTQQQQQQENRPENNNKINGRRQQDTEGDAPVPLGSRNQASQTQPPPPPPQSPPAKPLSLYPAGIISFAMVARGEIGFLISAVAESNGVFQNTSEKGEGRSGAGSGSGSGPASELFLIVTWAIVLCTIIGPVCVGLLVRRVKRLENTSSASSGAGGSFPRRDVLGVWGVS